MHIHYEDYLLAVVKSPGSTKFPVDLASAARAVNATNAASPGTEVKAKGEDEEAIVVAVVVAVAVWHFLRGLPSHRKLIHLEGEIQSSEEDSRKDSQ